MATKNRVASAEPIIENKPETKVESSFSKEQLLASNRFEGRRDIVNALLSPDKNYTISAVEQMVENYMKGQVK